MKVEIWSDYVCPFCYIGKRKFEAALQQFTHKSAVEVIYKSFELDPQAKRDGNPGVHDMLVAKYGLSREQAVQNTLQITQQAKVVGVDFHFDRTIQTNTFDAHRLTHYAASQGKHLELTERLLKAYFTDALHIGDPEQLADLAAEIGLDRLEALRVLTSNEYTAQVRADEQEASQLGARGVPFFVINRKYAISGAQPSDVFLEALQKAWNEDHPLVEFKGSEEGALCIDDSCLIPDKKEESL
ncbi:DsbA family oxidoreductase [Paenibacillus psychroresistens]|uniref:DsbA family oxidoreductase n=1 Tax=Paenibacillus psychroresistens TaxID=1778678 RepID=A0A6B8RQE1_9BACL|nr:DsbA family oxidoreductase [Paenibacillus psychroresistens]QGQ97508.1 DsbA family oxidoreductase [Paenibacillus psychroresistens]